jgi:hypothetical protein
MPSHLTFRRWQASQALLTDDDDDDDEDIMRRAGAGALHSAIGESTGTL